MPPAVAIHELSFAWPGQDGPCLVIDSLEVDAGDRVFLYGPSGSGKSTLLGLLGGVLVPRRGRISVLGTRLDELRAAERDRFRADHVGFLFQLFNLVPYLSVLDNVMLACRFSKRRAATATSEGLGLRQEATRLLSRLDIGAALMHRQVSDLSVGQQQRVAAARALLGRPELIVADEPTSALDADRQRLFIRLLLDECAAAGETVVFVSHDRRLAAAFSKEVDLARANRAFHTPAAE